MIKRFTSVLFAAACCLFANAGGFTVNDLVGFYSVTSTGTESVTDYTSAADMSAYNYEVEITKIDDNTVKISNLLNFGTDFTGTVDLDAMTISIAPGTVSWATFASASTSDATGDVVATFDYTPTITIKGFGAWYGGVNYVSDDASMTLSKSAVTKDWSVDNDLVLYNGNDLYTTIDATLSKYTGASSYDYILDFHYANATPSTMKFTVSDSGEMTITNCTSYYNWYYFYDLTDKLYCAGFYTAGGYSSFEGNEEGGEFWLYCTAYESSTSTGDSNGYADFMWGTQDGISSVAADKAQKTAVYDLTGRKVADTTKAGIYIKNGKKFIVK